MIGSLTARIFAIFWLTLALVPRVLQQAFHLMRSGRPGPVLVDLPFDVQVAEIEFDPDIVHGLQALPSRIEQMLSQDKRIEALAEDFSDKHHALFLGRGDQYPIALEGALKLKEISYIHAEAYAAGELKHGPLALIDADMPVIVVAPNNELLEKLKSNIEEVRARGGQLYVFADQDAGFVSSDNMHIIEMPHVEEVIAPIFYTVPLQLLAYHVALIKGTDVDQPRNLAKSVTVE